MHQGLGGLLIDDNDQHGVNMNTGLTTFDGFPRSDIDVPQSMRRRENFLLEGSSDQANSTDDASAHHTAEERLQRPHVTH